MAETKTAFISIVGKPNVGKSSILNRLLGQKVAIVSNRPQTTRTKIVGVLTDGDYQLVFTDTPGFHKPMSKLGEKMLQAVDDSISGGDACLFVTESRGEIRPEELTLLQKLRAEQIPVVLAVNKTDTVPDKTDLLARITAFADLLDFTAVVPVSAKDGSGLNDLLDELKALCVPSPFFFPEDALTDQPERVLASERIREKLLIRLNDEIPHGIAVTIERMQQRGDLLDIDATIYCEKENHKGIIIGKGGAMLKAVSTDARRDLERLFDSRVNLRCWVKVKENWRNREGLLRDFGLDGQ
ncbi:MAG: GTPase Era [Clostridia bacterium]|nr:GTPase Era [Clostridia bacterium]